YPSAIINVKVFNGNKNYPKDLASTEEDMQINSNIRQAITGRLTDDYKHVLLKTTNNKTSVEGYVDDEKARKKLMDVILKIYPNSEFNVKVMDNAYQKNPQDRAATEQDQIINNNIRKTITGWFTDDYKNIYIQTENGKVTVEGYVKSEKASKKLIDGITKIYPNAKFNIKDGKDETYSKENISTQANTDNEKYPLDKAENDEDKKINKKIRDELDKISTEDYKFIILHSSNGIIKVSGYVENINSKKKLNNEILKMYPQASLDIKVIERKDNVLKDKEEGEGKNRSEDPNYPQDSANTESDKVINKKIRETITGWFSDSYKHVTLETTDGKILVKGKVKDEDAKTKLIDEIKKIYPNANFDVKVSENIDARDQKANTRNNVISDDKAKHDYPQDSASTEGDRVINKKVRDAITGWFTDDYKYIFLNTSHGKLAINGYVESEKAKTKLVDEIRKMYPDANFDVKVSSGNIDAKDQKANTRSNVISDDKAKQDYPQDSASTQGDREINKKVRDAITGWFTDDYKNIFLNTSHGKLAINGYVESEKAKTKLVDEIRKMYPDANVNVKVSENIDAKDQKSNTRSNDISDDKAKQGYPQDSASTERDKEINKKVRDAITGWFTDDYKYIFLNTSHGKLAIKGYVETEKAKTKLVDEIRKIYPDANFDVKVSGNIDSKEQNANTKRDVNFDGKSKQEHPQDSASTERDKEINKKVRDAITGWFTDDYKYIFLNTSHGKLTIKGYVEKEKAKTKLVDEIRKIYPDANFDVKVSENIDSKEQRANTQRDVNFDGRSKQEYSQDSASTERDKEINYRVRDTITGWFTDDYQNIFLSTSNGNLAIEGYVETEDARTKLVNEIRKMYPDAKINVKISESENKNRNNYSKSKNTSNLGNNLRDESHTEEDMAINQAIRSNLTGLSKDKYEFIILQTNKRKISVDGFVENEQLLSKLIEEVHTIDPYAIINVKVNKLETSGRK
ncbi:MAG: hypothetical protein H0U49_02715, partial [Parachlamydiaceae bacterium]|nr:hypothetical protein [Parachlamydiaceae bacterium]